MECGRRFERQTKVGSNGEIETYLSIPEVRSSSEVLDLHSYSGGSVGQTCMTVPTIGQERQEHLQVNGH